MLRRLVTLTSALLAFNIANAQIAQKRTFSNQTKAQQPSLSIEHFKLPKEIIGCNCTFSGTKEKANTNRFLFAAKNDGIGFISIGNKLIRLKLLSTGDTFGPRNHKNIYSSSEYKVTVESNFIRSNSEEVWSNQGIITVETKDGRILKETFVGDCGC